MPRTQNRSRTSIRQCAACGYELSPGHEGPCPMCPRFDQLRVDFTMPRPSELSMPRSRADVGPDRVDAEAWPPTPSEYRAILAERRRRLSAEAGTSSQPGVIRTPGLVRAHTPGSLPERAESLGDEAENRAGAPDAVAVASPRSRKKGKRKGRDRRAGRARARSQSADTATPMLPVGPGPSPPDEDQAPGALQGQPGGHDSATPAEAELPLARPWPIASPAARILPTEPRRSSPLRAPWWRIAAFALIIIVMSVLTGVAVSFMLPSP